MAALRNIQKILFGSALAVASLGLTQCRSDTPYETHYPTAQTETPLMVILVDFSDHHFQAHHTPTYYEGMFFTGEGYPGELNAHGYFYDQSHGQFSYSNAGMIGPIHMMDKPETTTVDESRRDCSLGLSSTCPGTLETDNTFRDRVLQAVELQAGVDLTTFDRNGDSWIVNDELTLVIVDAAPHPGVGAASRFPKKECYVKGSVTRFCDLIPGIAESANFSTAVHELSHALGTVDLYSYDCFGMWKTLMSCTVFSIEDLTDSVYLDPWHRIRLGWSIPREVVVSPGSSKTIELPLSPQLEPDPAITPDSPLQPILIRIENDFADRFLLLELRSHTAYKSAYDKDGTPGLNIWYFEITPYGYPKQFLSSWGDLTLGLPTIFTEDRAGNISLRPEVQEVGVMAFMTDLKNSGLKITRAETGDGSSTLRISW